MNVISMQQMPMSQLEVKNIKCPPTYGVKDGRLRIVTLDQQMKSHILHLMVLSINIYDLNLCEVRELHHLSNKHFLLAF